MAVEQADTAGVDDKPGIEVWLALAILGLFGLAALIIWDVRSPAWYVDWATVGELVGGFGTVGALIAGIIVFRHETRRDTEARLEETRRRANEDDRRRRQQAVRISAGLDYRGSPDETLHVVVHNASDEPIYDVWVQLGNLAAAVDTPGAFFGGFVTALVPGNKEESISLRRFQGKTHDEGNIYVAAVTFRDSNLVQWMREFTGQLHEEPSRHV